MRTKVLLCLAALAAGVASSSAQVYSLNVVGYVNVTLPGSGTAGNSKYSLVANPLNTSSNFISSVLNNPSIPFGANFYGWNAAGGNFTISTWLGTAWDVDQPFAPGQAGFILNDTAFTQTFVGEVLQGNLTNKFGAGFSLLGSQVPQAGDANTLGLSSALSIGDNVYLWNFATQGFDIRTFLGGTTWDNVPAINVADGFFIFTASAGAWTRTFTVQ